MSTDRRILVDNATLSGVERITGISQYVEFEQYR